jgi:hypothetical protein
MNIEMNSQAGLKLFFRLANNQQLSLLFTEWTVAGAERRHCYQAKIRQNYLESGILRLVSC